MNSDDSDPELKAIEWKTYNPELTDRKRSRNESKLVKDLERGQKKAYKKNKEKSKKKTEQIRV